MSQQNGNLAFSFRVAKNGEVSILRHGRVVTILRAAIARVFLTEVEGFAFEEQHS